jgi:hypothetical protein
VVDALAPERLADAWLLPPVGEVTLSVVGAVTFGVVETVVDAAEGAVVTLTVVGAVTGGGLVETGPTCADAIGVMMRDASNASDPLTDPRIERGIQQHLHRACRVLRDVQVIRRRRSHQS